MFPWSFSCRANLYYTLSLRTRIIAWLTARETVQELSWGVTKQSNAVTSNEKTSNGIKIQEVKKIKKITPNERKNVKMVVIS